MRAAYGTSFLAGIVMLMVAVTAFAAPQTHVYTYDSDSRQGYLGVQLQDVTKKLKEKKSLTVDKGAYVNDVTDESPAEKAGLKEGDVIVKFDGKDIAESDDLIEAVRKMKRDTDVKIDIVRQAERKTLTATIDRIPHSFSFNFRTPSYHHMAPMPRMPRMPMMPHMSHGYGWSSSSAPFDRVEGLELQELSRQLAEFFEVPDKRGVLVTDVEKGSEGEKAGFKAGDIITKIDGGTVRDAGDVSDAVRETKKSTDLPVDVFRKGKAVSLKWNVSSYRDDDGDDDDDTSMNMVLPHSQAGGCQANVSGLDRFKEEFNRFANNLRVRLLEMQYLISEKVSDFVDAVSRG